MVDAGSWFHPVFADIKIPTFGEVLRLPQQASRNDPLLAMDMHHQENVVAHASEITEENLDLKKGRWVWRRPSR